jgi:hypothetical protein
LPPKVAEAIEENSRLSRKVRECSLFLKKRSLRRIANELKHSGADFQKIVSQGINKELLQWKGIEATEKLAGSQNAKL